MFEIVRATRAVVFYTPWLGGTMRSHRPSPRLASFFSHECPQEVVVETGLQEHTLRYPLSIWYSQAAFARQFPVNMGIRNLARDQKQNCWYGTVVVLRYSGHRLRMFADICDSDLSTLSVYFLDIV